MKKKKEQQQQQQQKRGEQHLPDFIEQRTYAGEGMDHVGAGQLFLEIAVHRRDQVVDLVLVGGDILRAPLIGDVRGADQRLVALIGVDEDHPLVGVLDEIGIRTLPEVAGMVVSFL